MLRVSSVYEMRGLLVVLIVIAALRTGAPALAAEVAASDGTATSSTQYDAHALRSRWGFFVDLIDKPLIMFIDGEFQPAARMTYGWEVPGETMIEVLSSVDGEVHSKNRFEWDEAASRITYNDIVPLERMDDGSVRSEAATQGRVDRNTYKSLTKDSLILTGWYNVGQGWVLDTQIIMEVATEQAIANAPQMNDFYKKILQINRSSAEGMAKMQGSMTDAEFQARLERLKQSAEEHRLRKERKARERREFWGNVAQGMQAGASAFSEAMAESQQREEYMLSSAQAAVREGQRQYEMKMAAAQASNDAERVAMNEPLPAEGNAGTEVIARHQPPAAGATVQTSKESQTPQESQTRKESPKSRQVALLETLEAIIVCTHPNEAGRFKCDTPVDVNFRGGPNRGDLWRTPEDFVSRAASCSDARRLESATHLVWGCGYGATNGGNTMDRSAGVDVKGRNTYFCAEREWPCRRTSQQ